ncbi:hypothetical protein [Leptonema illini]|uniref:Uncharacterized protein n=1 Tax=Leptonema illini DSM 21528 TaxID=929563 RepID=H2CG93_9LEPT|nr:hypothetical protein [Leptonema illini]EHQ05774.1 hypothetical protein Lepil_1076 [Leptonema illini DSM 21528]
MRLVRAFLLIICFSPSILAEPVFLVGRNGSVVHAEFLRRDGGIFIRDSAVGATYDEKEFTAIYPASYRTTLEGSRRLSVFTESLVFFNAGEKYVWNPNGKYLFWSHDATQRGMRLLLVGMSILTYSRAAEANRKVRASIPLINSSSARKRFVERRSIYYTTLGVTSAYFVIQPGIAAYRYGRNAEGADLRPQAEPLTATEYIQRYPPQLQAPLSADDASITLESSFRF